MLRSSLVDSSDDDDDNHQPQVVFQPLLGCSIHELDYLPIQIKEIELEDLSSPHVIRKITRHWKREFHIENIEEQRQKYFLQSQYDKQTADIVNSHLDSLPEKELNILVDEWKKHMSTNKRITKILNKDIINHLNQLYSQKLHRMNNENINYNNENIEINNENINNNNDENMENSDENSDSESDSESSDDESMDIEPQNAQNTQNIQNISQEIQPTNTENINNININTILDNDISDSSGDEIEMSAPEQISVYEKAPKYVSKHYKTDLPMDVTNDYYPFQNFIWLNLLLRIINKDVSINAAMAFIRMFEEKQCFQSQNPQDDYWIPHDSISLYYKFVEFVETTEKMEVIQVPLYDEEKHNVTVSTVPLGYISPIIIAKHIVKSNLLRKSYNMPLNEWKLKFKSNPIHQAYKQPRGLYHVSQTTGSRLAFALSLDQVCYIKPVFQPNIPRKVCLITFGTFVINLFTREFALIIKVLNDKWTNSFMKETYMESLQDWQDAIAHKINQNELDLQYELGKMFQPKVEWIVLKLKWFYQECVNPTHDHFNQNDRKLYYEYPKTRNIITNEINHFEKIEASDEWFPATLIVDNKMVFRDPNLPDLFMMEEKQQQNAKEKQRRNAWYLNHIKWYNKVTGVLEYLYDILIVLHQPYERIRPSINTRDDVIFIHFLANSDGVQGSTWLTNILPLKSIKMHWICVPMFHTTTYMFCWCLSPNYANNKSVRKLFELDILQAMFDGIDVEYMCGNAKKKMTIFMCLVGKIDDGAETTQETNTKGPTSFRISQLSFEKSDTPPEIFKFQDPKHFKNNPTTSVKTIENINILK